MTCAPAYSLSLWERVGVRESCREAMVSESVTSDFPPKLSKPAQRALANAGYTRLAQLTAVRGADLAKLHGMGPKALGQLREALAARGESFAGS
jgi:hypothetical protein